MIADLGSAAVLGFVLGPVVGLICTTIDFSWVSPYSACGWLQAIFTIVMFIASVFFFQEIPREQRINHMASEKKLSKVEQGIDEDRAAFEQRQANERREHLEETEIHNADQDKVIEKFEQKGGLLETMTKEEEKALEHKKPNLIGVIVCFWIFLIHFNGFAVQETITTPIVTDIHHKYTNTLDYPESFAYILFTCAGVLSVLTFLALKYLNEYVSDFNLVLISVCLGLAGFLILIDYSPRIIEPARFVIGFAIISVAFPFG